MTRPLVFALALAPSAISAQEAPFRLALPIDCTPGEDCFIQNYVDADPGPEAADFTCGPLSYDDHKGTDIRVATIAQQREGVDVLAAAPGVVLGLRDEMPDILQGWDGAPELNGRDCGNGVSIAHDGGWETQYCHMARGSVAVKPGDRVETGARLGSVGLSGQSQFPHLHLSVRKDGVEIDPFDPDDTATCGDTTPADTLWDTPPAYLPGGLLDAGFAPGVPDWFDIQAGEADAEVTSQSPLVIWGYAFGARAGDTLRLTVTGPQGSVIDDVVPLDKTQAQLFRANGRRAPEEGWAEGDYVGRVALMRDGEMLGEREVPLSIGD
ncbi:M23 family metallopeptidase [uncultured Limimaricola sp.]|mgnify:CR=1 FL=1|uniref:M23 family metallopeptidase n=1 Tax=uncultured Limimaricola sp. TaxID=2211667 RepID=UPI0030F71E2A